MTDVKEYKEYRVKFVIKENEWFNDYQEWAARNSDPGWAILYKKDTDTYYFSSPIKEDAKKFSKKFGGRVRSD